MATEQTTPQPGSGEMFDAIADRYDLLNRIISLGVDQSWRRRTVGSLELGTSPSRVLDLATGTGDLALMIARTWPRATVVGVDPSKKMLEIGERKAEAKDLASRVEMRHGDAHALPLEDDSVDACTIAFGIRNVPDRALGLREMNRVTKPGGRIAILELGEPRSGLMGALARFHVHHVVPGVGALLSGRSEYRYLQRSIAAFPPADEFAALMESSGIVEVAFHPLTFGACTLYLGRAS